jgi:hypothetical protein
VKLEIFFSTFMLIACNQAPVQTKHVGDEQVVASSANENPYPDIKSIPLPAGFKRLEQSETSIGSWLRNVKLKKDKTVYVFDGSKKAFQGAQFAVCDISTGKRDLQQCADAVMRMRAEYLYAQKDFSKIHFKDGDGFLMSFDKWRAGNKIVFKNNKLQWQASKDANAGYPSFMKYLEMVFAFAGTATLTKELVIVDKTHNILPGDVFIYGGAPGHAATVMDVAQNIKTGKKIFMLAQGYMPAQDIHVIINPNDKVLNPWYSEDYGDVLNTVEWAFDGMKLKRFVD